MMYSAGLAVPNAFSVAAAVEGPHALPPAAPIGAPIYMKKRNWSGADRKPVILFTTRAKTFASPMVRWAAGSRDDHAENARRWQKRFRANNLAIHPFADCLERQRPPTWRVITSE